MARVSLHNISKNYGSNAPVLHNIDLDTGAVRWKRPLGARVTGQPIATQTQVLVPIEAGLLANPAIGVNFLLPIWAMANVAQGGACLAVYFKTRDVKIKAITVPAAMSCLLGITEAAIFGVNLRYIKPFLAGLFGGACGGAYVVAAKVGMTAVGLTGIPGMAIVQPMSLIHYVIGLVIAFGAAFAASYLLKYKVE